MATSVLARPTRARSNARRVRVGRVVIHGALIVLALFYLMPLWVMVTTSLKSLDEIYGGSFIGLPEAVTLDAWRKAWSEACIGTDCTGLRPYFVNSFLMCVPAVICFTTLFFRNYFVTVPDELVRAAQVDGAGFFRIFVSIMLPAALPIVVVSCIWQFTNIWNDFLFGVSFTSGDQTPITVALNNIVNVTTGRKQYNVDMAAAMIAALPTLVVYVVAGRYFVRGLTAGAVKG